MVDVPWDFDVVLLLLSFKAGVGKALVQPGVSTDIDGLSYIGFDCHRVLGAFGAAPRRRAIYCSRAVVVESQEVAVLQVGRVPVKPGC